MIHGDLNRGSNHKSRDLTLRFELPIKTVSWGKFLRFGIQVPHDLGGQVLRTTAAS